MGLWQFVLTPWMGLEVYTPWMGLEVYVLLGVK